jgi:hypothetical protein
VPTNFTDESPCLIADKVRNEGKYLNYGQLDGIMFHGEQCGSYMGVYLRFVSSRQQLSAVFAICSQSKLVRSVVRHGMVYFRATCISG